MTCQTTPFSKIINTLERELAKHGDDMNCEKLYSVGDLMAQKLEAYRNAETIYHVEMQRIGKEVDRFQRHLHPFVREKENYGFFKAESWESFKKRLSLPTPTESPVRKVNGEEGA